MKVVILHRKYLPDGVFQDGRQETGLVVSLLKYHIVLFKSRCVCILAISTAK